MRRVAELRDQARSKRKTRRQFGKLSLDDDEEEEEEEDNDDDEDEEDDEEEDDDDDDNDRVPSPPPQPPKDIDSKKLPILLSLFCGPKAITGETMFFLENVGSIAEIKSLLSKHFYWEMKRAGVKSVPADLNLMRLNCFSPDREGPIRGAWPISTVDVYTQWWEGLAAGSWKSGQFARIQVVAMTDYMLWRDEKTYRDYLKLDENPVAFWFQPLMEEMDGTKWVFVKLMDEAIDGTEWTGEKAKESEKEGEEENDQ